MLSNLLNIQWFTGVLSFLSISSRNSCCRGYKKFLLIFISRGQYLSHSALIFLLCISVMFFYFKF